MKNDSGAIAISVPVLILLIAGLLLCTFNYGHDDFGKRVANNDPEEVFFKRPLRDKALNKL